MNTMENEMKASWRVLVARHAWTDRYYADGWMYKVVHRYLRRVRFTEFDRELFNEYAVALRDRVEKMACVRAVEARRRAAGQPLFHDDGVFSDRSDWLERFMRRRYVTDSANHGVHFWFEGEYIKPSRAIVINADLRSIKQAHRAGNVEAVRELIAMCKRRAQNEDVLTGVGGVLRSRCDARAGLGPRTEQALADWYEEEGIRRDARLATLQKVCPICGDEFTAKTVRKMFCSTPCLKEQHRRRMIADRRGEHPRFNKQRPIVDKPLEKRNEEIVAVVRAAVTLGLAEWPTGKAKLRELRDIYNAVKEVLQ